MSRLRTLGLLTIAAWMALAGPPAKAAFHLWFIKEIYSNYNGGVQFVELFTTSDGQQFLPGHDIRSNGTIFPFPINSPAPTGGHHLLLGTPAYAALAGIPGSGLPAPNYTFAANSFFNVAGDTINFAGGFDINTFASVPTDGVMSLNYTSSASAATTAANTPRNYAGTTTAALNLPPSTGDYNGDGTVNAADYTVWRNTLGQAVTAAGDGADGNRNSMIDEADYIYWKVLYGNVVPGPADGLGAASLVPEPTTLGLALVVLCCLSVRFDRRRVKPTVGG